jgi:hypothetical protein
MKLGDIKIIDLNASVVDDKLSKPSGGDYVFKSKRYVDYKGTGGRPDYWFRWIRHEQNNQFREERDAGFEGYTYVQSGVDPYWPESVPPDGEGHYIYGDVVLMKRPLMKELDARIENARLSRGMAQAKINAYKIQLREANADIPQGLIDELI